MKIIVKVVLLLLCSWGTLSVWAQTLTKGGDGSAKQSVILGKPIQSFTYTWTNATGITVSGLPTGVTYSTNGSTATFSGSPATVGSFAPIISTTGGSSTVSATLGFVVSPRLYNYIVAADGSGDYTTVKDAIKASSGSDNIFIKNGTYTEKDTLNKTNLHFIGQSAEGVVIQWDDIGTTYNGKTGVGTMYSSTFQAEAAGLYMENLTIKNFFGKGSQAVALRAAADKQAFKNVRLISFQDTYYSHNPTARHYFYDVYVEGATDFIFGNSTDLFEKSEIRSVNGGYYVTAPATAGRTYSRNGTTTPYGHIFKECNFTRNSDLATGTAYFIRPWKDNGSTVIINSKVDTHINAAGGKVWNSTSTTHETTFFAEYNNTNSSGTALNTSSRVDWWTALTASDVSSYYTNTAILGDWDPSSLIIAPSAPSNLTSSGNTLDWDAISGVKGYLIIRNDTVAAFTTTGTFAEVIAEYNTTNSYQVYAIGSNGNLSETAATLTFVIGSGAVASSSSLMTSSSSSMSSSSVSSSSAIAGAAVLTKHGGGSSTQTVAAGSAITAFSYAWQNATGANVTGLPDGVTGVVDTDSSILISGTVSVTAVSGDYAFTVTTTGSISNASKTGKITVTGGVTGIANVAVVPPQVWVSPSRIKTHAEIRLYISKPGVYSLQLVDFTGRIYMNRSESFTAGENILPFNRGSIPAGMYFLKVEGAGVQCAGQPLLFL